MRKYSLYMIIATILGLSIGRSIKSYRYRCYGLLKMLWDRRNSYRTYSVIVTKYSFPYSSIVLFACGTKENGLKFIHEFSKKFPGLISRDDFCLSVDGMWTVLANGAGVNMANYSPSNDDLRRLFKRMKISESVTENVIEWTNLYWTNMLKQYCQVTV